jgi:hypothetical protein
MMPLEMPKIQVGKNYQFVKISKFREDFFLKGSAPSVNSVKKMIKTGELTGKKLGCLYYVVVDEKLTTYDLTSAEQEAGSLLEEKSQYSNRVKEIIAEFS